MDTDLALTLGLVLLAFSLPSLLSGWVGGRLSRFGLGLAVLAAALIVWAQLSRPEGFALREIPDVVLGVIARVTN